MIRSSEDEMQGILKWCVEKFGTKVWAEVSDQYVQNSAETREIAKNQMMEGEGHRLENNARNKKEGK